MWSGQVSGVEDGGGGGGWDLGIGGRLACLTSPSRLAAADGFGEDGGVRNEAAGGEVGVDTINGGSGVEGGELRALNKEVCLFNGALCSTGLVPVISSGGGFGTMVATGRLWKGLSTESCRAQTGGVEGGLVGVVTLGDFGFRIVVVVPAA